MFLLFSLSILLLLCTSLDYSSINAACGITEPYLSFDFRHNPPKQGGTATKIFKLQGNNQSNMFTGTGPNSGDGYLDCPGNSFILIDSIATYIPGGGVKTLTALVELRTSDQTSAGAFSLIYDPHGGNFNSLTFDTPYWILGSNSNKRTQLMDTTILSMDNTKWKWITIVDYPPNIKIYINGLLIKHYNYDIINKQTFATYSILSLCAQQLVQSSYTGEHFFNGKILYAELRTNAPTLHQPYCLCNHAKTVSSLTANMICTNTTPTQSPSVAPTQSPINPYLTDWAGGNTRCNAKPPSQTLICNAWNRYAMVSGISHFTMWNGETHEYNGKSLLTQSNNIDNELGFYYIHECKHKSNDNNIYMPFRLIGWHVYKENSNPLILSVLNRISLELKPLINEINNIKNKYIHFTYNKYEIIINDETKTSTRFSSSANRWINTDISVTVGSMIYKIKLRTGSKGKREVYLNIGHGGIITDDFSFKFKQENRYGVGGINIRPKQNQLLFYASPPVCYRCLVCGILGDFVHTNKKTFDKQGNIISILDNTNWAQDWIFEPVRRRLNGLNVLNKRQNELGGLCNDNINVYNGIQSSCKAFFESHDIIIECCNKISIICVYKQEMCEFDSCIEYNTNDYVDYNDVTDAILNVSMAGICDEANILSFVDPNNTIVNVIQPLNNQENHKKNHQLFIVIIVLVIVIVVVIIVFGIWFCYCRKGQYQLVATVSTDDELQEL